MDNKHHCRTCKGLRHHITIAEKRTRGAEDYDYFQWTDDYFIIECKGCETVSFLRVYGNTEMVEYDDEGNIDYVDKTILYPAFIENGREIENFYYLPREINTIYKETLSAFKADAYILTAGGFRAIIEATCNHLKIRKDDLSKRIDLLHGKGFLSLNESKRLHSIRFLGNDALHEMETPKKEQLLILLEIVNHLLENLFIHDKKIADNIDTLIDTYVDFSKLLRNKISKELLGKELTLFEILGKSKRLMKATDLKEFECQLISDIENAKLQFLAIEKKDNATIYKVIKAPDFIFDF